MTTDGWRDTLREVGYNLQGHRRQNGAVVLVIVAAVIALSASLQWWALVDRALQVTLGDRFHLSVLSQATARPILVIGVAVCAVLAVTAASGLAHARRREAERVIFERLGGSAAFTTRPALVEGALQGLLGGIFGSIGTVIIAPLLTSFERDSLPSEYSITTLRPHSTAHSANFLIQVSLIKETATTVVAIALLAIATGVVLGVMTSWTVWHRPNPRLYGDPESYVR